MLPIFKREAHCWHLDLESKSTILVLAVEQLACKKAAVIFLEGSISSWRCTYKACTDDEYRTEYLVKDKCLANLTGSQRRNNSATNGLDSMESSQQQRLLQKKSAKTAIQPLSMSVKCLPRELEMKKLEEKTLTKFGSTNEVA